MSKTAIPPAPLLLGLAGLIPFWALAIGLLLHGALGVSPPQLDAALATYGAIIVSFLGGIRWGLAVPAADTGRNYLISVLPSLVAWALLAAPEPSRLAGLGLVALLLGPIDLGLVRGGLAPAWFGTLRIIPVRRCRDRAVARGLRAAIAAGPGEFDRKVTQAIAWRSAATVARRKMKGMSPSGSRSAQTDPTRSPPPSAMKPSGASTSETPEITRRLVAASK